MPVKDLQQILKEIMREGKKYPGEWKSIMAPTRDFSGSDLLVFHPTEGPIFQVRAYEKNPFKIQGMGTRLSRSVDEDFLKLIDKHKQKGNMGILDLNYKLLEHALKEGGKMDKILFDAILGKKDQGLDVLNLGPSYQRPEKPLPLLTEEQKRLEKEYMRLVNKDQKNSMYG
ncbi:MAG: hypothetical protein ACTSSO_03490 [Candidatus Hodarchaeales archaeon]